MTSADWQQQSSGHFFNSLEFLNTCNFAIKAEKTFGNNEKHYSKTKKTIDPFLFNQPATTFSFFKFVQF